MCAVVTHSDHSGVSILKPTGLITACPESFNWTHYLPNQQSLFYFPVPGSFTRNCVLLSFSFWASHPCSLHSSTWNKCMLVLVASVAMLVSTGLRGLADLWCSTPRERLAVSTGATYCFLSSILAFSRGTLFPHVALSWSAIDYVSDFICMNVLCLSSALHSSEEEMFIQLCPKAVIFLCRVLGKAP